MAKFCIIFLTLAFISTVIGAPYEIQKCEVTADVLLLIDASASINSLGEEKTGTYTYFDDYVKPTMVKIAEAFPVSDKKSRIGLTLFGEETPRDVFDFTAYNTNELVSKAINDIQYPEFGSTHIAAAMKRAKEIFSSKARNSVKKTLFFVTDGKSIDSNEDAENYASEIKAMDVTIITVAIGVNVDEDFLKKFATIPEDYIQVNFENLLKEAGAIIKKFCEVVKEGPEAANKPSSSPEQRKPPVCEVTADVLFVIDGSQSIDSYGKRKGISDSYFKDYVLKAIAKIAQSFPVSKEGTRIALTLFGDKVPKDEFDFTPYTTREAVETAIENVQYPEFSATYIGKGMLRAKEIFSSKARKDVKKALFFATDGVSKFSSDIKEAEDSSKELKSMGVTITTVGIGKNTNVDRLKSYATTPSDFIQVDFENLETQTDSVIKKFCDAIKKEPETVAPPQAPHPPDCPITADVLFLVDGSRSIFVFGKGATGSSTYFEDYVLKAMSEIAIAFPISEKESRIAFTLFGDKPPSGPKDAFGFTSYNTRESVKTAIEAIKNPFYASTWSGEGMKRAKEIISKTARSDVKRVLIFVTDGESGDDDVAEQFANDLKGMGVVIVSLGIGNSFNEQMLKKLATKPEYYYQVDFKNLLSLVRPIVDKFCDAVKDKPKPAATTPKPTVATAAPVTNGVCSKKYLGATYCWPFDKSTGGTTSDEFKGIIATFHSQAIIETSVGHGMVLSLLKSKTAYVSMGDYKGQCMSDPDKCQDGLTVLFWLRMTSRMITDMTANGYQHQYIISSGGQRKDSRGFAFLYQKDAAYTGFKIQLQISGGDYVIQLQEIPEDWFMFTFTFHIGVGLTYYQNGQKIQTSTMIAGSYATDYATSLTVGKPNKGDSKYFGRFKMDELVVWYKTLSDEDVLSRYIPKITTTAVPSTTAATSGAACGVGYEKCKYCFPFETQSSNGDATITIDVVGGRRAQMKGGASIVTDYAIGKCLSLSKTKSYVMAGDFKGECASDLDLCSKGITVMFWIRITFSDLDAGGEHQYIASSGGQVSSARGWSILYVKSEEKFKIQFQTSNHVYLIEISRDQFGEDWFLFTITFKTSEGLFLYINNNETARGKKTSKSFPNDQYTLITIGKPNHENKYYSSFFMDHFVIFYWRIIIKEIEIIYNGKKLKTTAAPETTPTVEETTTPTTEAPTTTPTTTPPYDETTPPTVPPPVVDETTPPTVPPPPEDETTPAMNPDIIPDPTTTAATPIPPPDITTTVQPPLPTGKCATRLDLVIILDNSGSIEAPARPGLFDKLSSFTTSLYQGFEIGVTDVALVESSGDPRIVFSFGQMKGMKGITAAVNEMKHKKQRSFMGKALELTRSDLINKVTCKTNARVVIIVTDGYVSDDVETTAMELRDQGVLAFAIGVGDETPFMSYTLGQMASQPISDYRFILNYEELIDNAQKISSLVCKAATRINDGKDALSDETQPTGGVSFEFKQMILYEVNHFRRMHSATPLQWSVYLHTLAQKWAEYLAKIDKIQEKSEFKYGQTIFISKKQGSFSAQSAVRSWYNQIIFYNFQSPTINSTNSYFAQLVWRPTTRIGVGKATSGSGKTYIVAFYDPAGLNEATISYNVLPVTGSAVIGLTTGTCPQGYQESGFYCYKIYPDARSWKDAVFQCNAQRSSLASITSDEESYFVSNVLKTNTISMAWLGLNDRLKEGSFLWVDGMPLSFNGWQTPPRSGTENNCVMLSSESGWVDSPCANQLPFVCKALKPGDTIFMITIHYPTDPWNKDYLILNSQISTTMLQRIDQLIMSVYTSVNWFSSYTVKSFRGHVSVYVEIELRFTSTAPIDPLISLKNITYTQDCIGFICDLLDINIIPAMNVTYNSTSCAASCYAECSSTCDPMCCAPQSIPPIQQNPTEADPYMAQQAQESPPPIYIQGGMSMQTLAMPQPPPPQYPPPSQVPDNSCPPACAQNCTPTCPNRCCILKGKQKPAFANSI